jgi:hypothetical protein
MHMSGQADTMNQDRERFTIDIAQKADTIRKLLEDHQELSRRVELAENNVANIRARAAQSTAIERMDAA